MDLEYMKIGAEILDGSISCEISKIAERNPSIGIPMQMFWSGEITWEEQIDMIAGDLHTQVIKKLMYEDSVNMKDIRNTNKYNKLK